MADKRLKYRALVDLSKSQIWTNNLKPELEKMRDQAVMSEAEPGTFEEAAMRDIKRATTIRIINTIIRLVERAEDKAK